jgi:2-methylisocitrate lyase-like PEP mutase family enzyme
MSNWQAFKSLHEQQQPLLLANVWDAKTVQLAQKAGFKAMGSSSHAMANALGYEDGESISFEEILFVLKRMSAVATIPLSADFEAGYSDDPKQVSKHVSELTAIGIVGINLEDGVVENGKRKLGDAALLAEKIKAIKASNEIFINARIDTYTTKHPNALEESVARALQYKAAGADGVFVPLIEKEDDIRTFIEKVGLPLNVFASKTLPSYEKLGELGVKRISHGAKQYEQLMKKSEEIFSAFLDSKDYSLVLGK